MGFTSHLTTDLPAPTEQVAIAAWGRVLINSVDSRGRIDFTQLLHEQDDLETYVAYLANAKPGGNRSKRIADAINTYNALAMYAVIKKGIPDDFDSFFKRLGFFKLTSFLVGGKKWSLYDYENKVVRAFGDPRVHFALNCMSVGCPRLPQVPFSANDLEHQLEAATREFINSDQYVRVDRRNNRVFLSEIFHFYRKDFIVKDGADSLIGYINNYLPEAIPEQYRIEYIPYDWTVNIQRTGVSMAPKAGVENPLDWYSISVEVII